MTTRHAPHVGRLRLTAGSLSFGLSRELWLVEAGIFLNMLGYGAVLPFEVIYLHDGRGFSLGVAGLVVGTITGVAIVTAPSAGPLIDRGCAVRGRLPARGRGTAPQRAGLSRADRGVHRGRGR